MPPKTTDSKKDAIRKAKKFSAAARRGELKKSHKVHTQVRFHRPKTLKLERKPQFLRRSALLKPRAEKLDKYDIIRHPLSTEKAMQKMENENTMVFIVDNRANKHMIKKAFEKLYSVKIRSVNTLNRPDGKKKAYIRLSADNDSLSLANTIGII